MLLPLLRVLGWLWATPPTPASLVIFQPICCPHPSFCRCCNHGWKNERLFQILSFAANSMRFVLPLDTDLGWGFASELSVLLFLSVDHLSQQPHSGSVGHNRTATALVHSPASMLKCGFHTARPLDVNSSDPLEPHLANYFFRYVVNTQETYRSWCWSSHCSSVGHEPN